MADTGTPLSLPLMPPDGDRTPHVTFNNAMAILNRGAQVDESLANEVSITTTATLTATAFGKMHVITGTSANYTITLPTPVTPDLGKIIGFRVADAATKLYTLDAAGTETIDGQLTFILGRNDVVYLKAIATTGNSWEIVGYKMAKASARVFHSAAPSIANNAWQVLNFDSERFDTDTIHDTATNNSRLTCKTPGKYQITFFALFDAHATGWRGFQIKLNGATVIGDSRTDAIATAAIATGQTVTTLYDLVLNDYVEAQVLQNSGAALNILAFGNISPEFMMVRVG